MGKGSHIPGVEIRALFESLSNAPHYRGAERLGEQLVRRLVLNLGKREYHLNDQRVLEVAVEAKRRERHAVELGGVDHKTLDRLTAARGPGASYGDVILRLARAKPRAMEDGAGRAARASHLDPPMRATLQTMQQGRSRANSHKCGGGRGVALAPLATSFVTAALATS